MHLFLLIAAMACSVMCTPVLREYGSCDSPNKDRNKDIHHYYYYKFLKLATSETHSDNVIWSPTVGATLMAIRTLMKIDAHNDKKRHFLGFAKFSLYAKEEVDCLLEKFEDTGLDVKIGRFLHDKGMMPEMRFKVNMILKSNPDLARLKTAILDWYKSMSNLGHPRNDTDAIREVDRFLNTLSDDGFPLYASIVNFNARFQYAFIQAETTELPFHRIGGDSIYVPTMYTQIFVYSGLLPQVKSAYIGLRMIRGSTRMIAYFILPDSVDDFDLLKKNIHTITAEDIFNRYLDDDFDGYSSINFLDVYVPKFTVSTIDKRNIVIGPTQYQDDSEMEDEISLGNTIQEVTLALSEWGFGTSRTTSQFPLPDSRGCRNKRAPRAKKGSEFRIDRPFAVVIVTSDDSLPLMTALITNPQTRNPVKFVGQSKFYSQDE